MIRINNQDNYAELKKYLIKKIESIPYHQVDD